MSISEPIEIDPRNRVLLEQIGRLRVHAWATFDPTVLDITECWLDEFELSARHWVILNDAEPVAAARMSVHQRLDDVPDAEIYVGVFAAPLPAPTRPDRAQAPSRSKPMGWKRSAPQSHE
jgi:hypothetical protein